MKDRAILANAYMMLLRLSIGASRINVQPALASVRDEIARIDGRSPEEIQRHFEMNEALRVRLESQKESRV